LPNMSEYINRFWEIFLVWDFYVKETNFYNPRAGAK
jgi:hypothetical protein